MLCAHCSSPPPVASPKRSLILRFVARLVSPLHGLGVYGTVYLSQNKVTKQQVAVKKIKEEKLDSQDTEGISATTLREVPPPRHPDPPPPSPDPEKQSKKTIRKPCIKNPIY